MATQIPVVLLGTSPNFTGIGELQSVDTLAGVFNHADLTANSLAAKVGVTAGALTVADNSLVGRVPGSNLGALNASQLAILMETVLDRAGSGFTNTGQFVAYQNGTGFVAVSPGADGEALVFNSAALGGISAASVASQLNGLSDVTISAPATAQTLRYNGAAFVNAALSVDDLSDVDITTVAPTDGQVLAWDNANSKFAPVDQTGGGGTFDPATDLADIAGNPIGNAQSLTLASGSSVSESTGELTLTSSTTTVAVDDQLKVNTLPSAATPANVITSNAGVMSVSTIAELATQITIGDLNEVDLTGLGAGQTLTWSGTQWEPGSVASQLNGLSDVSVSSPVTGHLLVHNGVDFSNRLATLNDLDNVLVGTPANGDILAWSTANSRFESVAPNATGYVPGNSFGGANLPDVGDITLDAQGGGDHRIDDSGNNLRLTSAGGTLLVAGALNLGTTAAEATPTAVATLNAGTIVSSTIAQLAAQVNLNDLGDVNAPTPSNGEALVWDSATSKWIPGAAGSIGSITSDLDMQGNSLTDYATVVTTPDTVVDNILYRESVQGTVNALDLDALPETAAGETTDELFHKTSTGNLERLALENLPAHDDAAASGAARTAGQLWTASADNYLGLPEGTLVTGPSGVASGTAAAADTPQMKTLWAMNRYGDSVGMEIPPVASGRHTPHAEVATANIPTEAFSDGLTVKCDVSGTFATGSANPGLTLGFLFGDAEKYTNGSHTPDVEMLYPPVTGLRGFGGTTQSLYTDETSGILASYLNIGTNALWHGYDATTGRGNELLWNCDATLTFEGGISTTSRVRVRGELTYNRPLDNMSSASSIVQGRRNVFDLRDDFPAVFGLSVLPEARASVGAQEYFPYAKIQAATGFDKLDTLSAFTAATNSASNNLVTDRYGNYASLAFSAALSNSDTVTINDGVTPTVVLTAVGGTPSGTSEFQHGSTAADTVLNLVNAINHLGLQVVASIARDPANNQNLLDEVRLYSRTLEFRLTDAAAEIDCSNTTDCTVTGWTGADNVSAQSLVDRMLNIMPGIGEDWRRYWYPRVERIPFDFVKEVDTTQEGLSLTLVAGGATQTNSSDSEFVTWTAGLDTPIAGASTKFAGAGLAGLYTGGTSETPNELRVHENYVANFTIDGTTYNRRIRYDGKQIAQSTTQADNYIFSYAPDIDVRTVPAENHDGRTAGTQAAGATSIVLEAGDGANFYTSGGYALINNAEVIQYTGVSTDTLTGVTRGVAGTTDQEHATAKNVINVAVGTLKREVGSGGNVQSGGSDAQFVFSNFTNTNSANPLVFHDGLMWVSRVESNVYDSQNAPSTAENQPGTFDWRPLAADGADQMTVTSTFAWMIGGRVGQTD